jgi:phosphoesterase RecJ-like protein
LEEEPARLNFIPGYQSIKFQPIHGAISDFMPELLILLDGNNYERISRHDGAAIKQYVEATRVKTVIIDHHEPTGKDNTDVYINQNDPSCVSDVFQVCFEQIGWRQPIHASEITMIGLYADSGGFVYLKDDIHERIFQLVSKLLADGVQLEKIKNQLSQFRTDDLTVLSALLANTSSKNDYTYSFLSDVFIDEWLSKDRSYTDLQTGTGTYLDYYVRNIEGRQWGFIVYKNKLQGDNYYSVSFRSVGGVKDVAEIASKLGGGGHKPAAGAKFEATSLENAIDRVEQAINS